MSHKDMPHWNAFLQEQLSKRKANTSDTPPQNKIDPQEVVTDGQAKKPIQTESV